MRRSRPCLPEPPAESPLYHEELRLGRVFALAVAKLTRERHALERAFAHHGVFGGLGGLARLERQNGFVDDGARILGVLLQKLVERVGKDAGDRALRLYRAELAFCLPLELYLAELDRDNRREPLEHVFAGKVFVALFN